MVSMLESPPVDIGGVSFPLSKPVPRGSPPARHARSLSHQLDAPLANSVAGVAGVADTLSQPRPRSEGAEMHPPLQPLGAPHQPQLWQRRSWQPAASLLLDSLRPSGGSAGRGRPSRSASIGAEALSADGSGTHFGASHTGADPGTCLAEPALAIIGVNAQGTNAPSARQMYFRSQSVSHGRPSPRSAAVAGSTHTAVASQGCAARVLSASASPSASASAPRSPFVHPPGAGTSCAPRDASRAIATLRCDSCVGGRDGVGSVSPLRQCAGAQTRELRGGSGGTGSGGGGGDSSGRESAGSAARSSGARVVRWSMSMSCNGSGGGGGFHGDSLNDGGRVMRRGQSQTGRSSSASGGGGVNMRMEAASPIRKTTPGSAARAQPHASLTSAAPASEKAAGLADSPPRHPSAAAVTRALPASSRDPCAAAPDATAVAAASPSAPATAVPAASPPVASPPAASPPDPVPSAAAAFNDPPKRRSPGHARRHSTSAAFDAPNPFRHVPRITAGGPAAEAFPPRAVVAAEARTGLRRLPSATSLLEGQSERKANSAQQLHSPSARIAATSPAAPVARTGQRSGASPRSESECVAGTGGGGGAGGPRSSSSANSSPRRVLSASRRRRSYSQVPGGNYSSSSNQSSSCLLPPPSPNQQPPRSKPHPGPASNRSWRPPPIFTLISADDGDDDIVPIVKVAPPVVSHSPSTPPARLASSPSSPFSASPSPSPSSPFQSPLGRPSPRHSPRSPSPRLFPQSASPRLSPHSPTPSRPFPPSPSRATLPPLSAARTLPSPTSTRSVPRHVPRSSSMPTKSLSLVQVPGGPPGPGGTAGRSGGQELRGSSSGHGTGNYTLAGGYSSSWDMKPHGGSVRAGSKRVSTSNGASNSSSSSISSSGAGRSARSIIRTGNHVTRSCGSIPLCSDPPANPTVSNTATADPLSSTSSSSSSSATEAGTKPHVRRVSFNSVVHVRRFLHVPSAPSSLHIPFPHAALHVAPFPSQGGTFTSPTSPATCPARALSGADLLQQAEPEAHVPQGARALRRSSSATGNLESGGSGGGGGGGGGGKGSRGGEAKSNNGRSGNGASDSAAGMGSNSSSSTICSSEGAFSPRWPFPPPPRMPSAADLPSPATIRRMANLKPRAAAV